MPSSSRPVFYGFDAPVVMLALLGIGVSGLALGGWTGATQPGWMGWAGIALAAAALAPLALGCVMLANGLVGKRRVRDRIMAMINLRGDEQILDIGTGRGLLLIGAARRLRAPGRATGIDIFRSSDLSDNDLDRLANHVAMAGVEERVALFERDARSLGFGAASFEIVLSLNCIHNIEAKEERRQALAEAARVLKPGGRLIIGEWRPIHDYAIVLGELGLDVVGPTNWFRAALGPLWIIDAHKPAARSST